MQHDVEHADEGSVGRAGAGEAGVVEAALLRALMAELAGLADLLLLPFLAGVSLLVLWLAVRLLRER